jgi:hypothetical protein
MHAKLLKHCCARSCLAPQWPAATRAAAPRETAALIVRSAVQKDKSCLTKLDPAPYPPKGGKVTKPVHLKPQTPSGIFTAQVLVQCKGQKVGQFCAVTNNLNGRVPDAVFFRVKAIDARHTNLWVAVLICAFLGPVLLVGFLIWERGILAKQA